MPDAKFSSQDVARDLADAEDYPGALYAALMEMHRQVGDLSLDDNGVATRGLLVRHLVLPAGLAGTEEIFPWIASHLSRNTYLNIMDQYRPCGNIKINKILSRRIHSEEYQAAFRIARTHGLNRLDARRLSPLFSL